MAGQVAVAEKENRDKRLIYENGKIIETDTDREQDWSKVLFFDTQKLSEAIRDTIYFFEVDKDPLYYDEKPPLSSKKRVNYLLNEHDSEEFAKNYLQRLQEYISFTEKESLCCNRTYTHTKRFIISKIQSLFEDLEEKFTSVYEVHSAISELKDSKDFNAMKERTNIEEAIIDLLSRKKVVARAELSKYNVDVVNDAYETAIFFKERYIYCDDIKLTHVIFFYNFVINQAEDFVNMLNALIYLYKATQNNDFLHILLNVLTSFEENEKHETLDVNDAASQCAMNVIYKMLDAKADAIITVLRAFKDLIS